MQNPGKLRVTTCARDLVAELYRATNHFPVSERFGLTAQMRRAAVSIGSNVAEGCGKRSRAEGIRYLEIATGSAAETEHHLAMAADLDILPRNQCAALADEAEQVGRMIRALINRFPSSDDAGQAQEVLRT